MKSQAPVSTTAAAQNPTAPTIVLLTAKEAARLLKVSVSWLAKARLRGDGPRYVKFGRSVKYQGLDLIEYRKSKKRHSTSEPH